MTLEKRARIDGAVVTVTYDSRGPVSVSECPGCGADGGEVTSPRARSPVYARGSTPEPWRCDACGYTFSVE